MAKPKIAIIGAGRVGATLGRLLSKAGYLIGAVVTRRRSRAQRACRFIGDGQPTHRLSPAVLDAQIFLLATPDAAISGVAGQLARLGGKNLRGKIALHTSGALSSDVLRPLARRGAHVGSIHPLQTFTQPQAGRERMREILFAVEGNRQARRQASQLARAVGGYPVAISSRHKALYHAAAALACGHQLALMDAAARIFVRAGMPTARARRALVRLVREMLSNFERLGGRRAWTGPLERRDLATVRLHVRALRTEPALRDAYRVLGELALRLYRPGERRLAGEFRKLFD